MQWRTTLTSIACTGVLLGLAGCGGNKLTEASVQEAITQADQASQRRDLPFFEQLLAPDAVATLDMRAANIPEPLQLNKSQYLQLMKVGWDAVGSNYRMERSNVRIDITPSGKSASVSATVSEFTTFQGTPSNSTSHQSLTYALIKDKLQVTRINVELLTLQ